MIMMKCIYILLIFVQFNGYLAFNPTPEPSKAPINRPTSQPSSQPSNSPNRPTPSPTSRPTYLIRPSYAPSPEPTALPSNPPTQWPTVSPTFIPTTKPTLNPTLSPSYLPSTQPTSQPSRQPSSQPTRQPSNRPSRQPTTKPSSQPTSFPTRQPTNQPSMQPTSKPTFFPSSQPSRRPSSQPSRQPSSQPTIQPSRQPSSQPSMQPTRRPSSQPSNQPSSQPTIQPSSNPTRQPSRQPSSQPTQQPSNQPSRQPTTKPSSQPTRRPSSQPTNQPSRQPSSRPSRQPTNQPTSNPTQPTGQPSSRPSRQPTNQPTSNPSLKPRPYMRVNHTAQYLSIDPEIFSIYTPSWKSSHKSWIGIENRNQACDDDSTPVYPVCVDDVTVDSYSGNNFANCPSIQCVPSSECVITPSDTIDYLPPPYISTSDSSTICSASSKFSAVSDRYHGLEQGIPPFHLPVTPTRLNVAGRIIGNIRGRCELIEGAIVEAWQIDPSRLGNYTSLTEYLSSIKSGVNPRSVADPLTRFVSLGSTKNVPQSTTSSQTSLRDITCRGKMETGIDGKYVFDTIMPASYGPPRHIVFQVTAPGFETLTTRMYLDIDNRLQQLTTLDGETNTVKLHTDVGTQGKMRGFATDDDRMVPRLIFPGAIALDPRVATVEFYNPKPNIANYGSFVANFDIVLAPVHSTNDGDGNKNYRGMPALDINGFWYEENGGMIKIETKGRTFVATEFPHPRTWTIVSGIVAGDTIRGVNFFNGPSLFPPKSSNAFQRDRMSFTEVDAIAENLFAGAEKSSNSDNLWTTGSSTGVIISTDPFSTEKITQFSSSEKIITWTGPGSGQQWSFVPQNQGYRYLKLVITRNTGGWPGGMMVINEIEFYEGIMSLREVPLHSLKMVSPRTPADQKVTCSSFSQQSNHCWKAFDGITTSNSSWNTNPSQSYHKELLTPEFVLFDLGPNRYVSPTMLRIVCNKANLYPNSEYSTKNGDKNIPRSGCPKTFSLLGSLDNDRYELLYKRDLTEFENPYTNGDGLFYFVHSSPLGRPINNRCGSCDIGPNFVCNLDSYDSTCASNYCNSMGYCDERALCPAGQYMDQIFHDSKSPDLICKLCPPGHYGNVSGLTSSICSGLCFAGFFCPAGSVSPTAIECGGPAFFCPMGSEKPIPSSSGRKTIRDIPGSSSTSIATTDQMCDYGHYCVGGIQYPCPAGRYGNSLGLQTDMCSGECRSGEYCPLASVSPIVCDKGYYCPDGFTRNPCPAGTFGATKGLKDSRCSGLCRAGYYCDQGSTSAVNNLCPGGRYGATTGNGDNGCSGPCQAGYYCPPGSLNSTSNPCGSISVYCPEASSVPLTVQLGYYSSGGSPTLRTKQIGCEKGFYCKFGERISCPAGSFGDKSQLGFTGTGVEFIVPTTKPTRVPTNPHPTMNPSVISPTLPSASPDIANESGNRPTVKPTPAPSIYKFDDSYFCSGLCAKGYFCPENSTSAFQQPCPAGTFGAVHGLTNNLCSGQCPLGHFCPENTVVPIKCRAGIFGNSTGLIDEHCNSECWAGGCSDNLCRAGCYNCHQHHHHHHYHYHHHLGYYCPEGSVTDDQYECGDASVYCPTGSPASVKCPTGYYTIGPFPMEDPRKRVDIRICEPGYYCIDGVKNKCPPGTFGSSSGLSSSSCSGLCPAGYYCPEGTSNGTSLRCPAGRFGSSQGLYKSDCTNTCAPGYYCPEGSISAYELECGVVDLVKLGLTFNQVIAYNGTIPKQFMANGYIAQQTILSTDSLLPPRGRYTNLVELQKPNNVFCKLGSWAPLQVLPGYYSVGNNKTTRYDQLPCPMGSYCIDGIIHDCPAGRYGRAQRLDSELCSGLCQAGYFCQAGSKSRTETICPQGFFGAKEGLATSACSGMCVNPLDCPAGSTSKTPNNGPSSW